MRGILCGAVSWIPLRLREGIVRPFTDGLSAWVGNARQPLNRPPRGHGDKVEVFGASPESMVKHGQTV